MIRIINQQKDRYRPLFCTVDFYTQNQAVFKLWKQRFQGFTPTEKLKAWTVALSCLRRPDDWYGGLRKDSFAHTESQSTISFAQIFIDTPVRVPSKLPSNLLLDEALRTLKIKPLPDSCLRSLYYLNIYPLSLLGHIPSPRELLDYQLRGQRIITFNEDFESWPASVSNERDFLSFIIHDLIHADHFFKDNTNTLGQLGFYHFIEMIWLHDSLQDLCLSTEFKNGFEYIISDMNSHPVHLFKTLRAYLSQVLPNTEDSQNIWNSWILTWRAAENDCNALQKINTQLFSDIDALTVESFSISLGRKKLLGS